MKFDPYKILGVQKTSNPSFILKEYKKKVLIVHPDKGGTVEEFQLLQLAKDVLTNPTIKNEFDSGRSDGNQIWAWADGNNEIHDFPSFFTASKQASSNIKAQTPKAQTPKAQMSKAQTPKVAKFSKAEREAKKTLKQDYEKKRDLIVSEFRRCESELVLQFEKDLHDLRSLKTARLDEILL
jgi:curved DNA-binding protein CbpA